MKLKLLFILFIISVVFSQNPIVNTGIECEDNDDCTNFCELGVIYNTKCSFESYIYGYNDTVNYNSTQGYYVRYCSYNENKPIRVCDKGCKLSNNSYECNLNCPSLNSCIFNDPYICENNTLYQNIFNPISNECNYESIYNCSDYNMECSINSLNISMCMSITESSSTTLGITTSGTLTTGTLTTGTTTLGTIISGTLTTGTFTTGTLTTGTLTTGTLTTGTLTTGTDNCPCNNPCDNGDISQTSSSNELYWGL